MRWSLVVGNKKVRECAGVWLIGKKKLLEIEMSKGRAREKIEGKGKGFSEETEVTHLE